MGYTDQEIFEEETAKNIETDLDNLFKKYESGRFTKNEITHTILWYLNDKDLWEMYPNG